MTILLIRHPKLLPLPPRPPQIPPIPQPQLASTTAFPRLLTPWYSYVQSIHSFTIHFRVSIPSYVVATPVQFHLLFPAPALAPSSSTTVDGVLPNPPTNGRSID